MPLSRPLADRFWEKVQKTDACWLWAGASNTGRYGRITIWDQATRQERLATAHRVAYELVIGPIPDGMTLDHLCRNRSCVRPDHLEPVPIAENILRGTSPTARNSRKTHCPQRHPYEGNNLHTAGGRRYCRACAREKTRRRYVSRDRPPGRPRTLSAASITQIRERYDAGEPMKKLAQEYGVHRGTIRNYVRGEG